MNGNGIPQEVHDLHNALLGSLVPEHIHEGIVMYVVYGVQPGSFLMACFENNLTEACGCADDKNQRQLFNIVSFLYNEVPADCWGSKAKVSSWVARGGMYPRASPSDETEASA